MCQTQTQEVDILHASAAPFYTFTFVLDRFLHYIVIIIIMLLGVNFLVYAFTAISAVLFKIFRNRFYYYLLYATYELIVSA